MEMPVGEVVDRFSIELRKNLYGADNDEVLQQLRSEVSKYGEGVIVGVELGVYNAEIASLEWAVREAKELSLEEIGRRAQAIRKLNGFRVAAKNRFTKLSGQPVSTGFVGKGDLTADEWARHPQELR